MAAEASRPEARISIITLGVSDLQRSIRFYEEGLGWHRSSNGGNSIAFFQMGGAVLALYPWGALAADAEIADGGAARTAQFRGFTLAHNVRTPQEVDRVLEHIRQIGGRVVKEAGDMFWGGRSGYFADPDGFLWEVAWNPSFPILEDGSINLPK